MTAAIIQKMGCMCAKESLTIDDRKFFIRSRIGEGGFSYIDLIEESTSHKTYALKRILCHSKEEELIAMQEVEVMRAVNHPNVIPLECHCIHKVDQYTKAVDITCEVFLVLPLYRKGSLQDSLEILKLKGEKLAEDEIWKTFLGICQGVKALHDHKPPYSHRDLKPDNVMTQDDGSPVVMDLGSVALARLDIQTSRQATSLQDTAAERSSMLYRAPELFTVETNSSIDERTDIWSLGCILFAMAYLESPFEKAYQQGDSLALATMGGKVNLPEISTYSPKLNETILWMLKPDPHERPFVDQVLDRLSTIIFEGENRV